MKVARMTLRHDAAPHPVFRQVVSAIRQKKLLRPDNGVLVAVSGGSDSVCLLMVLHEMRQRAVLPGLDLHVGHVNYGLRGEESEKDEEYVRELGTTLSLPVHVERVHVVPQPGQTVQGQARDARYAFFARVRREYGLTPWRPATQPMTRPKPSSSGCCVVRERVAWPASQCNVAMASFGRFWM